SSQALGKLPPLIVRERRGKLLEARHQKQRIAKLRRILGQAALGGGRRRLRLSVPGRETLLKDVEERSALARLNTGQGALDHIRHERLPFLGAPPGGIHLDAPEA